MDKKLNDYEQELLNRIISFTNDKKSEKFWIKAISLNALMVEQCLGDVKADDRDNKIKKSKSALLVHYLKQDIPELAKKGHLEAPKAKKTDSRGKDTQIVLKNATKSLYSSQMELFDVFGSIKIVDKEKDEGKMSADIALGNKTSKEQTFPLAALIEPAFFTLSTNKKKSDKVKTVIRTVDGQTAEVELVRGKTFEKDRERGILTAEHGRILGAISRIWEQENRQKYTTIGKSDVCCCVFKIKELAKELGIKSFNGGILIRLKQKIMDIAFSPYFFNFSTEDSKIKSINFTLLRETEIQENKNKKDPTYIRVEFGELYSKMLLDEKTNRRHININQIQSELGYLIRLMIEPSLMSSGHFQQSLTNIIKRLNLPVAKWHDEPAKRRQIFNRAIKELDKLTLSNGKVLSIFLVPCINVNSHNKGSKTITKQKRTDDILVAKSIPS